MRKLTLNQEENKKQDSDIQKVIDQALGTPFELSAAPTTAGGELPYNGDSGWYSGNLYINLGGTVRRIAYTDV